MNALPIPPNSNRDLDDLMDQNVDAPIKKIKVTNQWQNPHKRNQSIQEFDR